MTLEWQEIKTPGTLDDETGNGVRTMNYHADVSGQSDESVKSAVEQGVEKAVAMLASNIRDDSCYMLCEWDRRSSTLRIVVTDVKKESDSPLVVECSFGGLNTKMQQLKNSSESDWESEVNDCVEKVQYWARDYLTTCAEFMNYSLVAAFHSESRSKCALL